MISTSASFKERRLSLLDSGDSNKFATFTIYVSRCNDNYTYVYGPLYSLLIKHRCEIRRCQNVDRAMVSAPRFLFLNLM